MCFSNAQQLRVPKILWNQGQNFSNVRSLQGGQVGENLARCKQQAFRDKHGGGHDAYVEKMTDYCKKGTVPDISRHPKTN